MQAPCVEARWLYELTKSLGSSKLNATRARARARLALRHACLRCHAETKSLVGPYSQQVELCGARAVPIVWTVRDSKGELLPRFIAGSPREVARKIVTTRYDAFRLEVSASYREQFDRDLKTVLARHDWQIVPLKRRTRAHRRNEGQLELNARPYVGDRRW